MVADWEYACRAGSLTSYYTGDNEKVSIRQDGIRRSRAATLILWAKKLPTNSACTTCMETCGSGVEDDWHDGYKRAPDDGRAWIDKPRSSSRVMRGGSWYYGARDCRSAVRGSYWPFPRSSRVGFRLSRSVALGP
jgi:formylglycine-generating enzyme required for sulfatase activity